MQRMGAGFRYEIIDKLKASKVWIAKDRLLDIRVCIKLKDDGVRNGVFKLKEPFLLEYIDEFSENKNEYVVYKYVEGVSLKELLEREEFEETSFEGIVSQVVEALEVLHTRYGVLHNDLKPSNIIVDSNGSVTLIDLIGTPIGEPVENLYGTPGYICLNSDSEVVDEKIDIYAFGKCVEEMLVGLHEHDLYKGLVKYCTTNSNLRFKRMHEVRGYLEEKEYCACRVLGVPGNFELALKIAYSSVVIWDEEVLVLADKEHVISDIEHVEDKKENLLLNQYLMRNISERVLAEQLTVNCLRMNKLKLLTLDTKKLEDKLDAVMSELKRTYKYIIVVGDLAINNRFVNNSIVSCSDCYMDGILKKSLDIKRCRLVCNNTNRVAQDSVEYKVKNHCKIQDDCIKLNLDLGVSIENLTCVEMKDFSKLLIGDD